MEELKNPVFVIKDNLVCPASATADTPYTMFKGNIGGQYGSKIYSLSLSFSDTFTQNYYYVITIDGIQIGDNQYPNNYQQPDITTPVIDMIKQDTCFRVPAGATLEIKAYNNTSTTDAGSLSFYIEKDDFSQSGDSFANTNFKKVF